MSKNCLLLKTKNNLTNARAVVFANKTRLALALGNRNCVIP